MDPKFHEGETAVQRLSGVPFSEVYAMGQAIKSYLPDQHRHFFEQLPFLVAATVDEHGLPWASIVSLKPEMIAAGVRVAESPDDETLVVRTVYTEGDPLWRNLKGVIERSSKKFENLSERVPIGLLGIMLHNRRRNRANGFIKAVRFDEKSSILELQVQIEESFGNCPKYIQARSLKLPEATTTESFPAPNAKSTASPKSVILVSGDSKLPPEAERIISTADTFFVATRYSGSNRLDASHRGGNPGFLRLLDDGRTLVWPDFKGNNMFQTLGNINSDGVAGIVIVDLAETEKHGDIHTPPSVLYLSGKARVASGDEATELTPGFSRCVVFEPLQGILVDPSETDTTSNPFPFATTLVERSPFNPKSARLDNHASKKSVSAILTSVEILSPTINAYKFWLSEAVRFLPGQHAILSFDRFAPLVKLRDRLSLHLGHEDTFRGNDDLVRVWTVSNGGDGWRPDNDWKTNELELTVKVKEGGLVTTVLHQLTRAGYNERPEEEKVHASIVGIDGEFTAFSADNEIHGTSDLAASSLSNRRITFAVAGAGITPSLATLRGLRASRIPGDRTSCISAHIVYVASTATELMPSIIWADFLVPEIQRRRELPTSLLPRVTATFVITRDQMYTVEQVIKSAAPSLESTIIPEILSSLCTFHAGEGKDDTAVLTPFNFYSIPSSAIDISSLLNLPEGDEKVEVFVCGPPNFMQGVQASISRKSITLRSEDFGY
ncbi:hypothetical protein HDU93_003782 [Gonapodya sp. JEL0774]|nr:hypothetical protein HDU93_003782 [Gonapodya sp. JEL0774]